MIFKESLDALAGEHAGAPGRFRVRHVLEQPPPGWTGGTGRLDGAALARELDALGEPDLPGAEYFLCGPAPMMAAARACLEQSGVVPSRIREERFVSAHAAAGAPASTEAHEVTLRMRGGERRVIVGAGRTILETALDAAVDMPFSCAVGGCGTCRVRLAAGSRGHGRAELPLGRRASRWIRPRLRVSPDVTLHARSAVMGATAARAAPDWPYKMADLCRLTGMPRQAVHFYIRQGLVPPGRKTGRNSARYGDVHIERIRIVRQLQSERFMPLKAIRAVLDGRDDAFTPEQLGFLVDVKRRLSSTLARPPDARRRVDARALLARNGLDASDLDDLVRSQMIEFERSPRGTPSRLVGRRVGLRDAPRRPPRRLHARPGLRLQVPAALRARRVVARGARVARHDRPALEPPARAGGPDAGGGHARSCTNSSPATTPRRSATSSPQ